MRRFEQLAQSQLSSDQAIQQALQAIAFTGRLSWTMPLALGLRMNNRYADALEALQRLVWMKPAVIWPTFTFCWAWLPVR